MLQIVHDIAPKAKECFATAETGDLGFAGNIRALGDPKGACRANVKVDDVGYFDEPFFSRGPISDAVDAVAAQGVHYFSSAGNGSSQQAYGATLQIVPPQGATTGSNLKLDGVDPKLYAGGFQDFDPGPGQDIAQSMVLGGDPTTDDGGSDGILDLQWDDPVDANGAPLGDPLIDTTGRSPPRSRSRSSRSPAPPGRRSARSSTRSRPARPTSSSPSRTRRGTSCSRSTRARARRSSSRRCRPPARTASRSPASRATSATSRSRSSRCSAPRTRPRTSTRCSSTTTATSCSPRRTSTSSAASRSRSPASTAAAASRW